MRWSVSDWVPLPMRRFGRFEYSGQIASPARLCMKGIQRKAMVSTSMSPKLLALDANIWRELRISS